MAVISNMYDFNNYKLIFETGKTVKQANGAVWLQYGKMTLLATVVINTEAESQIPYVPLSTTYIEKDYSRRVISGPSTKRETPNTPPQIIISRIIDRPIRPLFPDTYRNETNLDVMLLSNDPAIPPDVMAVSAASIALTLSDAPYHTQMAGARVCKYNGRFILNPDFNTLKVSEFNIFVAGTKKAVTMIEGDGLASNRDEIIKAIEIAHNAIQRLIEFQEDFISRNKCKLKIVPPQPVYKSELFSKIIDSNSNEISRISEIKDADIRDAETKKLLSILSENKIQVDDEKIFSAALKMIAKKIKRSACLNGFRVDGRVLNELRHIECEVGVLPSAHGSALFMRGDTHSLGVTTIGSERNDSNISQNEKSYFLHYNFPPFSVGEPKRKNSLSRREVGHGFLAEKSIKHIMPQMKDYKHTIRIVSEILESDGSSSMATVCSASLSLKDANVPITGLAAGISIGLIQENDRFVTLSDINEDEDHFGDMDFKIAGVAAGVTGLQLDIKVDGVSLNVLSAAIKLGEQNRIEILDKMEAVFKS